MFTLSWVPRNQDHAIHLEKHPDGIVYIHTEDGMSVGLEDDEVEKLIRFLRQMKTETNDE